MSVFLVRGDDPTLRDEALSRLIDELAGDEDRSLVVEDLTVPGRATPGEGGGEDEPGGAEGRGQVVATALNAAQSPPFMTSRRVVVVRDAGNLAAGDTEPFLAYLADPLESTALVFVAGGSGRIPASLTKALKDAGVTEHGPAAERTGDVLGEHLRDAGVKLRPDAAKLVAAHLGEDAGRVPQLVAVLAAANPSGGTLDVDDVELYLGEAGSVPGYQLTNAIEAGDVPGALTTLRRMLTAPERRSQKPMHPLQVIGLLHSYYRKLLRLDDPDIRGPRDAVDALGGRVKEYPARKALEQSRALQATGLRQAYEYLAQADLDLKGKRAIPEDAVMEVLVARLAGLSNRARRGSRRR